MFSEQPSHNHAIIPRLLPSLAVSERRVTNYQAVASSAEDSAVSRGGGIGRTSTRTAVIMFLLTIANMEHGSERALCIASTQFHSGTGIELVDDQPRINMEGMKPTKKPRINMVGMNATQTSYHQSTQTNQTSSIPPVSEVDALNLTIPIPYRSIKSALKFICKNNLQRKGVCIQIFESVPDGIFELKQKFLRFRCKVSVVCIRPTLIREGTWKLDANSSGSAFAAKLFDRFGCTVIVRGAPWTFENCELRNIMGAAVRIEKEAVVRFVDCAIGGEMLMRRSRVQKIPGPEMRSG
eukprot:762708-Hanusia_phi.AAC.3